MNSLLCRSLAFAQRKFSVSFLAEEPKILRSSAVAVTNIYGMDTPKWISTSSCLFAEPLKKKKRLDPAIIKAREERRKRKLEKQIKRLEKNAMQLKPLQELDVPMCLIENYRQRERRGITISPEEEETRWLLQKEWTRYMFRTTSEELRMIDRMLASQRKALNELRLESEELYQAAIQLDYSYIPSEVKGPVETPPIKDFVAAEGDYNDISRKWD